MSLSEKKMKLDSKADRPNIVCVCVCVCVCFVGVLIVSGESGYRGSLNVLVHSPANQQTL